MCLPQHPKEISEVCFGTEFKRNLKSRTILIKKKKKKYYFDIYPSALISNCQRYNHVQIEHKYHLEQREHKHKEVRPVLRQYRQWKPNLAPRDYKAKSYIWDTRPVQGKDCID